MGVTNSLYMRKQHHKEYHLKPCVDISYMYVFTSLPVRYSVSFLIACPKLLLGVSRDTLYGSDIKPPEDNPSLELSISQPGIDDREAQHRMEKLKPVLLNEKSNGL